MILHYKKEGRKKEERGRESTVSEEAESKEGQEVTNLLVDNDHGLAHGVEDLLFGLRDGVRLVGERETEHLFAIVQQHCAIEQAT